MRDISQILARKLLARLRSYVPLTGQTVRRQRSSCRRRNLFTLAQFSSSSSIFSYLPACWKQFRGVYTFSVTPLSPRTTSWHFVFRPCLGASPPPRILTKYNTLNRAEGRQTERSKSSSFANCGMLCLSTGQRIVIVGIESFLLFYELNV